jgi:hypothetical protein
MIKIDFDKINEVYPSPENIKDDFDKSKLELTPKLNSDILMLTI